MGLDLTQHPGQAGDYQDLVWAVRGVKKALTRLMGSDASYHDAIEAAFWIGAAAEAVHEEADPYFSAFYFVANKGRHETMIAFQSVHRDEGPMEWADVTQWLHPHAMDPILSPNSRAIPYHEHLAGKRVDVTIQKAETLLLALQQQAEETIPPDATLFLGQNGDLSIRRSASDGIVPGE